MPRPSQKLRDRKKSKSKDSDNSGLRGIREESLGILLLSLAVFIGLSLYSHYSGASANYGILEKIPGVAEHSGNIMGAVGTRVSALLISALGYCSFVVVIWALLLSRSVWTHGWRNASGSFFGVVTTILGSLCMAASCAVIASVLFGYDGGGRVGSRIAYGLVKHVNEAGTLLISLSVFFLSLGLATGIGTSRLASFVLSLSLLFKEVVVDTCRMIAKVFRSLGVGNFIIVKVGFILSYYVYRSIKQAATAVVNLPILVFEKARDYLADYSASRREEADSEVYEREETTDKNYVLGDLVESKPRRRSEVVEAEAPIKSVSSDLKIQRQKPISKLRERVRKKLIKPVKRVAAASSAKRSATTGKGADKKQKSTFLTPSTELLAAAEVNPELAPKDEDLVFNCRRLEKTLLDFRIGGRVVEVHPGPVITLYQFEPAAGVKVQRIVNLADDLALALRVASVRVYAPVPGKGTVGIEVPNSHREIVRLREIIESNPFITFESSLTLAIGKTTFGEPFVADLAKMPHLLIAGATGSGKSVCINSLLMSLLFKNTPDDLRLILIDPKMLELSVYEDIPHLLVPVVTNPKRARGVLWWAVQEMERRYKLMKDYGVRNLTGYNSEIAAAGEQVITDTGSPVVELGADQIVSSVEGIERGDISDEHFTRVVAEKLGEKLPRIVIVIDEMADLMLTVGREIEQLLTRLAQKARAAGIHLVLATQRPSVNVITGLIKANFPARISFQVASRIDARTVMDSSGAEKLLGHGDMLFMLPGTGSVRRLHSAFVSDKEVHDTVDFVRSQGRPKYDMNIEEMVQKLDESEAMGGADGGEVELDPLYDQAVNLVIDKGQASTSMVQRVFRIGYNRAARILESMEREGVVGPADGAKPRQVLVPHNDRVN